MCMKGRILIILGMIFKFYINGTVSISMKAMVGDLVDDMSIKVDQISTTPAAQYLFEVSDGEKPLENMLKNGITLWSPRLYIWQSVIGLIS